MGFIFMVNLSDISLFLADIFSECGHTDVSNNGLQVQGSSEVSKILFAVDACQASFDSAVSEGADLLIVHHGISWGGGLKRLSSYHAKRLKTLFNADISLMAFHLPLDAHPEIGNNAVLADMLKLQGRQEFFEYGGGPIAFYGSLETPCDAEEIAAILDAELPTECLILEADNWESLQKIAVVSGGGADALEECAELGLDCLVTGEVLHQHVHLARELGITVIEAGHYASETCGIKKLQEKIAKKFPVECKFVDIPTGL